MKKKIEMSGGLKDMVKYCTAIYELDGDVDAEMIYDVIELNDQKFYLFKELKLKNSEKEFISFALDKKPMSKVKFIDGLNWDEEKVLRVMKSLQTNGVLRIEKNNIIIPGIIQKI